MRTTLIRGVARAALLLTLTISACVIGNGLFVAVCSGAAGPIIYSEDGINWQEAYCPTGFGLLYGIARRP